MTKKNPTIKEALEHLGKSCTTKEELVMGKGDFQVNKEVIGPLDKQSFYEWCLANYLNKDNALGDLAGDMKSDDRFPKKVAPKSEILAYLYHRGACKEAISAFKRAWKRYEKDVINNIGR
jgi:uncharacterized protein YozE (UPF0346 family)